ncbi:M28 family metallopeptidase [Sphingobacterium sp. LRF_L2]|uniref:M28 family metallopeptidase n=1 Tax=Sphingobacterium sp. LRF_L2 TaxID=3369421 RepID=UPI003F62E0B1
MQYIKILTYSIFTAIQFTAQYSYSQEQYIDFNDIQRVMGALTDDSMRGRAALTPDIGQAADFIANEFRNAGLKPYAEDNFRQTFHVTKVSPGKQLIRVNGEELASEKFIAISNAPELDWTKGSPIEILEIKKGEDFSARFREIVRENKNDNLVWVDPVFESQLARFKKIISNENVVPKQQNVDYGLMKVFAISPRKIEDFEIKINTLHEDFPLFNVAAILPGKTKADEFVIFSAHYDHIGILDPVNQDSIANGADDDASGTAAMIALAKHFRLSDINERTLIFVAFTAEEIGMFGSKYFSSHIDADKVAAMINIEMIGKDSKFGPNSLYVTGYNNSNLASLMQENLKGTKFKFYPDPYPQQNLFYRSDNAVLAALGVPAHTFSTSQIDKDEYYHTVKDELSTLDLKNIQSSIEAIAQGVLGIVKGLQTPSRVEKLKD